MGPLLLAWMRCERGAVANAATKQKKSRLRYLFLIVYPNVEEIIVRRSGNFQAHLLARAIQSGSHVFHLLFADIEKRNP